MNLNNINKNGLAYGGDSIYDCNGYRIHIFNKSGLFNIINPGFYDIFVVGGGAGGGVNIGGGGGGIVYTSNVSLLNNTIPITVGLGGYPYPDTTAGQNSSFGTLITAGGGNIGIDLYNGGTSGFPQNIKGLSVNLPYGGGGGGISGIITNSNNGIDGLTNNISGGIKYYGGGGAGCGNDLIYEGIGGLGGGGSGSYKGNDTKINALPNTGGGGGACGKSLYTAGRGGSGIVIIRYQKPELNKFTMISSNESIPYSLLTNITVPSLLTISTVGNVVQSTIVIGKTRYNVYKFIENGTLYCSSSSGIGLVDILVVGGGGGGSTNGILSCPPGNGGGGGEVIFNQRYVLPASSGGTSYDITIGSGGLANQNGFISSFSNLISARGGKAGVITGGGNSGNNFNGGAYFVKLINETNETLYRGSGGGGAYGIGTSSTFDLAGLGGDGLLSDITGQQSYYGTGGGGGGLRSSQNNWVGGNTGANGGSANFNNGKGGDGGNQASSAIANTGGGGGGGGQFNGGGTGGSGVVIIRTAIQTPAVFLFTLNIAFYILQNILNTSGLTYVGENDSYICNYNTNGIVQWSLTEGGNDKDNGNSITVDSNGNILLVGIYSSPVFYIQSSNLNQLILSSHNEINGFITKYSSNSTPLWAASNILTLNSGAFILGSYTGVANSSNNNIYIVGNYTVPTLLFNPANGQNNYSQPLNLTAPGALNGFLVKYSSNGDVLWAVNQGGSNNNHNTSITIDKNENIYIGGYYDSSNIIFNSVSNNKINLLNNAPIGNNNSYLAKYSSNGDITWALSQSSTQSYINNITIDKVGLIYIIGSFAGQALLLNSMYGNSINLINQAKHDSYSPLTPFIAVYMPSGYLLWATLQGGNDFDEGKGIAVDSNQNIYVLGNYQSAIFNVFPASGCIGQTTLSNSGIQNIFLIKYDSYGNVIWALTLGGNNYDSASAITIDTDGYIYITGIMKSNKFTVNPVYNGTGKQLLYKSTLLPQQFIVKYDNNGNVIWVVNNKDPSISTYPSSITSYANSNIYITGNDISNGPFLSSPVSTTHSITFSITPPVTGGQTSYTISGNGFNTITGISGSATTYTLNYIDFPTNTIPLSPNTTYGPFILTTIFPDGSTIVSKYLQLSTFGPPTNVIATVTGYSTATITWSPPIIGASSYSVTGGGTHNIIGTTDYVTGLSSNTTYTFAVTSINVSGQGGTTSSASITTDIYPQAVTELQINYLTQSNAFLSWTAGTGASYYKLQSSQYVQTTINDPIPNDNTFWPEFGNAKTFSPDGNTLFISNPWVNIIYIYTNIAGTWIQTGTINPPSFIHYGSYFGLSMVISSDGNTLYIGVPGYNNNTVNGTVLIYTNSGGTWTNTGQIDSPITTVFFGAYFGVSIAISSDGNTLYISSIFGNTYGCVVIFTYSGGIWTQTGIINCPISNQITEPQFFGFCIALSNDGNTLYIGSPGSNPSIYNGSIQIFSLSNGVWTNTDSIQLIFTDTYGSPYPICIGTNFTLSPDNNILVCCLAQINYGIYFANFAAVLRKTNGTFTYNGEIVNQIDITNINNIFYFGNNNITDRYILSVTFSPNGSNLYVSMNHYNSSTTTVSPLINIYSYINNTWQNSAGTPITNTQITSLAPSINSPYCFSNIATSNTSYNIAVTSYSIHGQAGDTNSVITGIYQPVVHRFIYTGTTETTTISPGTYTFTVVGAGGATNSDTNSPGGSGRLVSFIYTISSPITLQYRIGGTGTQYNYNAGGGGATYLYDLTNSQFICVAGGGGAGGTNNSQPGGDATSTTFPGNGSGGIAGGTGSGGSGAGITGDGQLGACFTTAKSYANGSAGGTSYSTNGGFGGGGAGNDFTSGGGGGYTGGDIGLGGTSYCIGSASLVSDIIASNPNTNGNFSYF